MTWSRLSSIVTPMLVAMIAYMGGALYQDLREALDGLEVTDRQMLQTQIEINRVNAVQGERISALEQRPVENSRRIRSLELNVMTKDDAKRLEKRIDLLITRLDALATSHPHNGAP